MSYHFAHAESLVCAQQKLAHELLVVLSHATAVQCVGRVSRFQTLKVTKEKLM